MKGQRSIYVIGSLGNPNIPVVANVLRTAGWRVFDEWYGAGPEADKCHHAYVKQRGMNYREALQGYAAQHIFGFDKTHLDRCDAALLVMPAGKSGHLELGYTIGRSKPGYILFPEEPERLDVMHAFATKIFLSEEEMLQELG